MRVAERWPTAIEPILKENPKLTLQQARGILKRDTPRTALPAHALDATSPDALGPQREALAAHFAEAIRLMPAGMFAVLDELWDDFWMLDRDSVYAKVKQRMGILEEEKDWGLEDVDEE